MSNINSLQKQVKNRIFGTVTSGLNNTTNPVTFTAAEDANSNHGPIPGNGWYMTVDKEIMLVTAYAVGGASNVTATRAQLGTTAASHANGSNWSGNVVDQHVIDLQNRIPDSDVYANLPANGTPGRMWIPSDSPLLLLDDNSIWRRYGPMFPLKDPNAAGSWTNSTTAPDSTDLSKGVITLGINANSSSHIAFVKKAVPAAPYTITALVLPTMIPSTGGNSGFGIGLFDSVGGGIISFHCNSGFPNTYAGPRLLKWTNQTTPSADYVSATRQAWMGRVFMRIVDDNTTRYFFTSGDGNQWALLFSVGRTDFITPDSVFIGADVGSGIASGRVGGTCISWKESASAILQGPDW